MSKKTLPSFHSREIDLNNCDKEPIHLIGKIQNHGVLIAGHITTKKITRCSENCHTIFNEKPEQLFDRPISDLLPPATIDVLFSNLDSSNINYTTFTINDIDLDITAHLSSKEFVLEFEPVKNSVDSFSQQLMLTKLVSTISNLKNTNELNDQVAKMIKIHFNYDRVMIYQFDHEWNGSIIAEAKEENLTSWLGLHYPSTDIPVPARRLFYLENIRIVKDVFAAPVDIKSKVQTDFDLSKSELRAVSPVHIEYLINMKVGATLTMPIVSGKSIWGLIACHHYSPKTISYKERLSFKFLTKFFASQLKIIKADDLLNIIKSSSQIRGELINQIVKSWNIPNGLSQYKYTLNDLTDSQGATIYMSNKFTIIGQCPTEKEILFIIKKIKKLTNDTIYYTNHLMSEFPETKSFKNVASGVLCVFISEEKNDALLWFKPAIHETIYWGGKPQDKSSKDKNIRLSPRKSFKKWKEIKDGVAAPWKENEIAVVKEFRKNIMNFVAQKYDEIKLLNNRLEKAYKDLESFSYSVSHDLKAPLRGIDGFAQIIKEDYYNSLDDFGKSSIETIISSVHKMNILIDDILSYSGLDKKRIQFQRLSIQNIFEEEISGFAPEYPNTTVLIKTPLPEIYGDPSMITLLIRNLLENALKYSSREVTPEVKVGVYDKTTFYVQDNGIGFDQKNNKKIFKVFNRLNVDDFKGSGIGLSIVERIIDKHNGKIWVKSELGKGAIFYFQLNKENE